MSETVEHPIFGTLKKFVERDGTIDLMGDMSIGNRPEFRIHITGSPDKSEAEILQLAADSHAVFLQKEVEILKTAVNTSVTNKKLEEVEADTEEAVSREDALKNYAKIFILNYYTELDEVSIVYQDESGFFGTDIQVEANLAFTEIKVDA